MKKRRGIKPGAFMGSSMSSRAPISIAEGMMSMPKRKPLGTPMTEEMRAERERERAARAAEAMVRAEAKRARRAMRSQEP